MANDVKVLKYVFENQSRTCFKWKQNRFWNTGKSERTYCKLKKENNFTSFCFSKKKTQLFLNRQSIYMFYTCM